MQRKGAEACDSEQATLLHYARGQDANDSVENIDLILSIGHQITDGIGRRILFEKYLNLLAILLDRLPDIEVKDIVFASQSQ